MSLGDFWIVDSGGEAPKSHTYAVYAGTAASIKAGDLVTKDGSNQGYVKVAVDGGSSSLVWVGVAATTSTDTATADGVVDVFDSVTNVIRGYATTSSNLARSLVFTQVTLDVTSSVQTIDENDTSSGTFIIVGYDTNDGTVDFRLATNDHITAG